MRERRTWTDTIDGFTIEFCNWGFEEGVFDEWNYYVYFTPKNTPAEFWEKLLAITPGEYCIDYSASWLADLQWHCGITLGEFQYNGMQEICAVKAGCDYSHLWDEGRDYALDDLIADCRATITSAKELFGTLDANLPV